MRSLAIATLAFSLLSGAAFADALTTGTAKRAPTFANPSGTISLVAEVGTASRAPTFAIQPGTSTLVADIGTASRAPTFALASRGASDVHLARR